jgi:predicted  nucleic acid-binding Zn-ribbon protein
MKADVTQQRSLLELTEIDAELSRIRHRATHLSEQRDYDQARADHGSASDRLGAVRIALEDLDGQISHFESEIDAVGQREKRDTSMLDSGVTNAKQLSDLQHELDTLQRRRADLEDSLLQAMEKRDELAAREATELEAIEGLEAELARTRQARDAVLADIDETQKDRAWRRDELTAALDPDLVAIYERQRAAGGAGAGSLHRGRCGACRIEIDRGELARISAAAEDDVLRCPECNAILLRVKGSDQ